MLFFQQQGSAMEYTHIIHPFEPLYDEKSRVLILGSFPSVKSREQKFFYGHPQNRFWKVMAALTEEETPQTIGQKKVLLHRHGIALWDVIYSCDIKGSSDSSIWNAVPTDLSRIFDHASIQAVFSNGKTSLRMFEKYQQKSCSFISTGLPSTSPANAACSLEQLIAEWSLIKPYLL